MSATKKQKSEARQHRAEMRGLIMKHFKFPVVDYIYVTTTQVKDKLQSSESLQFIGQQMRFLGFKQESVDGRRMWKVAGSPVHSKDRTKLYYDILSKSGRTEEAKLHIYEKYMRK